MFESMHGIPLLVSIGGPARQQFRQKREPSDIQNSDNFFNWKLKNLIFTPKWPPWSNYNFWSPVFFLCKSDKVSEFRKSDSDKSRRIFLLFFLAQNNHVPQNQTFGSNSFCGFVRQSVRIQTNCQTGSEWNSDNCLADPLVHLLVFLMPSQCQECLCLSNSQLIVETPYE